VGISKASRKASEKLDQVLAAYECYDHQHAIAILTLDYAKLLAEICDVLLDSLDVRGGDKHSLISGRLRSLRNLGWRERKLIVRLTINGKVTRRDAYKLDHVKGKVACAFDTAICNRVRPEGYTFGRVLLRTRAAVQVAIGSTGAQPRRQDRQPFFFLHAGETYPGAIPTLFVGSKKSLITS